MLLHSPNVIAMAIVIAFTTGLASAQPADRSVALFDIEARNNDTLLSGVFSADHLLDISGVAFQTTQDFNQALQHAVVLFSSKLLDRTFDPHEEAALATYVQNGGILIAPAVEDEELFETFGILANDTARNNHLIHLAHDAQDPIFRWIDQPEEMDLSLGDPRYAQLFKTYSYTLDQGRAIGSYPGNKPAIVVNNYGSGFAYTFGFNWKELIVRNQNNRDFEAQRSGSNTFEPTQDALMLLIRGIYLKHMPFATWKHTSPGSSSSTLIITHDIDSETGMDSSGMFSDYELANEIVATYNVTVRYFRDMHMQDYYLNQDLNLTKLVSDGHVIGSHSVGHFIDFGDDEIFPTGQPGNTRENYAPFYDGNLTGGGTVYGECEVSKNVLEQDLNTSVTVFRPGHLSYNKYLPDVLDTLGYEYSSGYTSPDVMTYFPYFLRKGRSFNGAVTNVMEFPVSISDVFKSAPFNKANHLQKADIWLDLMEKIDGNGAPSTLLIHPNRGYKLTAMQYFLDRLSPSINIQEMTAFGTYWRARKELDYQTILDGNRIVLQIDAPLHQISDQISWLIADGQSAESITVKDQFGNIVPVQLLNSASNDVMVIAEPAIVTSNDPIGSKPSLVIWPNPTDGMSTVSFLNTAGSTTLIQVHDVQGSAIFEQRLTSTPTGPNKITIDLTDPTISTGMYLVKVSTQGQVQTSKIIKQ